MTDRELLEKAAKAAGVSVNPWHDKYGLLLSDFDFEPWNPLTDDADALRLAVKLRMDVTFSDMDVFAWPSNGCEGRSELIAVDDPYAATRRAIVRAAAAIGETL